MKLFYLLTITEHTLPLGSLPALPDSAAFQFSIAPKRLPTGDDEVGAAGSWQPFLSVSCQCDPRFSPSCPTIPPGQWEGEIILGRKGWMVVERTSWSVSALCWDSRLRNKPSVQRDLWWVRFKAKVCILTLLTWVGERKKWLRKPL